MIAVGESAPDIESTTTSGDRFKLSEQSGLCTVIYFFPKAFTPGCVKETKSFRDNYAELSLAGANLVGISTDSPETQCRFAEEMSAPFPLIADVDKSISRAYGVLWPIVGVAKRVTFVIATNRLVLAVFRHEISPLKHTDDVLSFVNRIFASARSF